MQKGPTVTASLRWNLNSRVQHQGGEEAKRLKEPEYENKRLKKLLAEANLIARREETAAMSSQANTAKLLESSPTLRRLRELEVLEKVAASGKLNVMLGEKDLAERVVNLL